MDRFKIHYSPKQFISLTFVLLFFYSCPSQALETVAAEPDHFVLSLGGWQVLAGEPFTIKLVAKDRFENTVANYSKLGGDVTISIKGTGRISPNVISAEEFKDGQAQGEFVYDRPGPFTIVAWAHLKSPLEGETIRGEKSLEASPRKESKLSDTDQGEPAPMPLLGADLNLFKQRLNEVIELKFSLEQRLLQLTTTLEEREKEILNFTAETAKINSEKEILNDELQQTQDILAQAQADLDSREKQWQEKFRNYANQEKRISQLSQSLEEKEQKNTQLAAELKTVRAEKEALQNQLIVSRDFLTQTKQKLDDLRRVNLALKESMERAEKKVEVEEVSESEVKDEEREKRAGWILNNYTVKIASGGEACIILPIGRRNGLVPGMRFSVYKNGQAIGTLIIAKLYEHSCIADIEETKAGYKFTTGDIIRLRQ